MVGALRNLGGYDAMACGTRGKKDAGGRRIDLGDTVNASEAILMVVFPRLYATTLDNVNLHFHTLIFVFTLDSQGTA